MDFMNDISRGGNVQSNINFNVEIVHFKNRYDLKTDQLYLDVVLFISTFPLDSHHHSIMISDRRRKVHEIVNNAEHLFEVFERFQFLVKNNRQFQFLIHVCSE